MNRSLWTCHRKAEDRIGQGRPVPDFPLEKMLAKIPVSRIPQHSLVSTDPKLRLEHAHGQSLPDWLGLRCGLLQHFPDGVARPASVEEVQTLLEFAAEHDIAVQEYLRRQRASRNNSRGQ